MIFIKNLKVFNCSINEYFHWSKLPKLKEKMSEEKFVFNRGADLSGADLSCADLSGADLRCANLSCANLSCADLRGANLKPIDDKKIIIKDFMSFNEILDSKEFTEKTENLQRESIENNDCTYVVQSLQFDYLVKLSKKYDWKKQKEEIKKECEKFNELIYSTIIKICQHENVGFLKSEGNIQSKKLYNLKQMAAALQYLQEHKLTV